MVKVTPMTEDPRRFLQLQDVVWENAKGSRRLLKVEGVRFQNKSIRVKFLGIADRTQAEGLRGGWLKVPHSERVTLPPDSYFVDDLIGCQIFSTGGEKLGRIRNVLKLPANDVYEVDGKDGELLIPAIEDVIKEVDIIRQRVVIEKMPGLLEGRQE